MGGLPQWQCRIAPSLGGGFAGTPNEAWGTVDYTVNEGPTVFFGMYGLPDYYHLWKHEGPKAILWAGSDIRHFINGYWLDAKGENRMDPAPFAKWIIANADSYVENEVEHKALWEFGIDAKIVPSFLGNIDDYEVSYEPNKKYYTSVSGEDFVTYNLRALNQIAEQHPDYEFHVYGTENWLESENVFVHGRVSQEQMNDETKKMQGAIRLTEFDGFSEILAKSVLWGQHPVSPFIKYPHIDSEIKEHTEPNLEGRDYYREHLNKYPWTQ